MEVQLNKVKEANYRRLADDQRLPDNPYGGEIDFHQNIRLATKQGYDEGQQDMVSAGFQKVELEEENGS